MPSKAALLKQAMHEIRLALEGMMAADDATPVGTLKPFFEVPLDHLRAALAKKQVDAKPPEFPEYHKFVQLWDQYFRAMGLQMPKDGKKIKNIILQCRQYTVSEGHQPTMDAVCHLWEWFLKGMVRLAYYKNLSTVDSQFNAFAYEIRNGKKRDNWNDRNSAQRIFGS